MDKPKVLVVDDEPTNIDVLSNVLRNDYRVQVALSGSKALAILESNPDIEIVFLDVMMPELDGYQTARQIKDHPELRAIDIIFVSAMDSEEAVVNGYQAGGTDYLTKPVRPEVLLEKSRLTIANRRMRAETEEARDMAMSTAMTAMTNAGELGVVLAFMRESFAVNDVPTLARHIVDSVAGYGLESSVQLRVTGRDYNASSQEPITALELEVLTRVRDAGRLREKGDYLIANYGDITLLVKNMPEDDEKRGRLRDHLAIIVEGAESRLEALALDGRLGQLLGEVRESLHSVEQLQGRFKQNAVAIMDEVMARLEASFLSYGLTEEQEAALLKVVQDGTDRSLDNLDSAVQVDELLHGIITSLEQVTRR